MRHCGGYILYHSSSIVILTNRNKRETVLEIFVTSNTTRQSSALYKGLISNEPIF